MEIHKALVLATSAHGGQYRKISKDPYIIHPIRVSELVLKYFSSHKRSEEMRMIALLHDVIEDTWVTEEFLEEKFGKEISGAVSLLTQYTTRDEYLEKLSQAPEHIQIVKLLDVMDNIEDSDGKMKKKTYNKAKETLFFLKSKDKQFLKLKKEILKKIS